MGYTHSFEYSLFLLEHTGNIGNVLFEINKCFELVAVIMGWKWTNDILIRDILWSVLKEWKMKGIQSKPQTTSDGDKSVRTSNEAVCLDSLDTKDKLKSDGNMEDTIANILCLLGKLLISIIYLLSQVCFRRTEQETN